MPYSAKATSPPAAPTRERTCHIRGGGWGEGEGEGRADEGAHLPATRTARAHVARRWRGGGEAVARRWRG
eukprot:6065322-Prymnesium_polylepis.1